MADHRSLQAWKSARIVSGLTLRIWRLHKKLVPFRVLDQLCGAAVSVQLNIAEGYALGTRKLFVRHLVIAFGSAVETEDLLNTLIEEQMIDDKLGRQALAECQRSKRSLVGLLKKYRPL